MKFKNIVCVDNTGLEPWAYEKLKEYTENLTIYDDYPTDNEEIISRVSDADCIMVSWNTKIDKEVIEKSTKLKYVGMCCSLYDEASANVDIKAARELNVDVRGVRDYGDEGVIEYIFSELIRLLKGLGNHQWKDEPVELTGRKLGIIGMGTLGRMLAKTANQFGMEVFYYSRTRINEFDNSDIKYLPLNELLETVEIISTHLPRNTALLHYDEFKRFGNNKILINTSLSETFDIKEFTKWISNKDNYAIFDGVAVGKHEDLFSQYSNIITSKKVSGWTREARGRLSQKVIDNIDNFLNNK